MKPSTSRIFTFLLVISISFTSLIILNVKAQISETIIIQPDGTIQGTTKIEQNGNTYKFTDNIETKQVIKIQTSNIIIDGAGYNLKIVAQDPEAISAIEIINQKNITIKRLSISGFNNRNDAIYINKANNITIENCTITDTRIGINVYHSLNIRLTQNKFTEFERTTINTRNNTPKTQP